MWKFLVQALFYLFIIGWFLLILAEIIEVASGIHLIPTIKASHAQAMRMNIPA